MSSPILDFHARLGAGPEALERLLAAMDEHGVERAAVSAGGVIDLDQLATQIMQGGHIETDANNEALLDASRLDPARLIPFYFGNPHAGPADYRKHAGEFYGLEVSPAVHGVRLDDERTAALVEVAAEFGHPVYIVCIGRPGCGADDLVALAERYPGVSFVLGHCGFIGIDLYSLGRVASTDNILAETSGCYTRVARLAVDRLGAHRVLFGSEYPLQHPTVELAKIRALRLDDAESRSVLWGNACRLLGLDAST